MHANNKKVSKVSSAVSMALMDANALQKKLDDPSGPWAGTSGVLLDSPFEDGPVSHELVRADRITSADGTISTLSSSVEIGVRGDPVVKSIAFDSDALGVEVKIHEDVRDAQGKGAATVWSVRDLDMLVERVNDSSQHHAMHTGNWMGDGIVNIIGRKGLVGKITYSSLPFAEGSESALELVRRGEGSRIERMIREENDRRSNDPLDTPPSLYRVSIRLQRDQLEKLMPLMFG